jgi:hypothetical protein
LSLLSQPSKPSTIREFLKWLQQRIHRTSTVVSSLGSLKYHLRLLGFVNNHQALESRRWTAQINKQEHKVENSTPGRSQTVLLTDAELEQWALEKVFDGQCDICGRDFYFAVCT